MATPYVISSDLVSAYPAKSLEIAQYIDGFKADLALVQNAQTGTTYTLAAADFTKTVTLSNVSPVAVTLPLEATVPWPAGTQLRLLNLGAGLVTVAGAVGVTINGSPLTLAQYKDGTLIKTGTDVWTFIGSPKLAGFEPIMHVREEQAQNTAGGTFTLGAWRTRLLNTVKTNNISGASLASNKVTLPVGTYFAEAFAVSGTNIGVNQTRVQNITGAATLLTGSVLRAPTSGSAASSASTSLCNGFFTLASISDVELQHQCAVTENTNGFGLPGNFTTEVYSGLMIWKV
jgi:hypothetical protein